MTPTEIFTLYQTDGTLTPNTSQIEQCRTSLKGQRLNWTRCVRETLDALLVAETDLRDALTAQVCALADYEAERNANGHTAKAAKLFSDYQERRQFTDARIAEIKDHSAFLIVCREKLRGRKPALQISFAEKIENLLSR